MESKITHTFNFAVDTNNVMLSLAIRMGITRGKVIQRGIALLAIYQLAAEHGEDIMVRKADGTLELITLTDVNSTVLRSSCALAVRRKRDLNSD
jgi:hypothetical protein